MCGWQTEIGEGVQILEEHMKYWIVNYLSFFTSNSHILFIYFSTHGVLFPSFVTVSFRILIFMNTAPGVERKTLPSPTIEVFLKMVTTCNRQIAVLLCVYIVEYKSMNTLFVQHAPIRDITSTSQYNVNIRIVYTALFNKCLYCNHLLKRTHTSILLANVTKWKRNEQNLMLV